MNEQSEKLIILLLGARAFPIPSFAHLQKEMFMLSKTYPKVDEVFNFQKHLLGVYSQTLQALAEEPYYFAGAYTFDANGIRLTREGREVFEKMMRESKNNFVFQNVISSAKLIRTLYDKLSDDELLFLMYITYPEFTELSSVYEQLVRNKGSRVRILEDLRRKGTITQERYEELSAMKF